MTVKPFPAVFSNRLLSPRSSSLRYSTLLSGNDRTGRRPEGAAPATAEIPTDTQGYADMMREILRGRTATSSNLLTGTSTKLKGQKTNYAQQMQALLDAEKAALDTGRNDYLSSGNARLDREAADQAAELATITEAERAAVEQAIHGGNRANKAKYQHLNIDPRYSSYAHQQDTAMRVNANVGMAQRLAAIMRQNRMDLASKREALGAGIYDRERADLGTIFGSRTRLADALAGLDRGDINFDYAGQAAINDAQGRDEFALEREIYNMNQASGTNLLQLPRTRNPLATRLVPYS